MNELRKLESEFVKNNENQILSNFFSDKENLKLLQKAIVNPDKYKPLLNVKFSRYYKKIKIINYVSKLIHYYSVDYDKKVTKRSQSVSLVDDEIFFETKSPQFHPIEDETYKELEYKGAFQDHILDKRVIEGLKKLSGKQYRIIFMKYKCMYSNKEIAKLLKVSEQVVSYHHRQAIKKLGYVCTLSKND